MSTDFDAALRRLKAELNASTDKALAGMLGMSPTALNDRKRRNAFPDDKLLALMAKQPELGIDYDYVVTGIPKATFDAAIQQADRAPLITPDERLQGLIDQLRPESRKALLQIALRLRELELLLTGARQLQPDERYPARVEAPPMALHDRPGRARK